MLAPGWVAVLLPGGAVCRHERGPRVRTGPDGGYGERLRISPAGLQRCGWRPPRGSSASPLSTVPRCDPDIHDDSLTLLHDDDDLALSVPSVEIPKGFSGLSQWIRSVDDRSDPSGLDQLLASEQ